MENAPGDSEDKKKAVLEQRRAILLTAVSETPSDNPTVAKILEGGYLNSVKLWLDEVLNKTVGKWNWSIVGLSVSSWYASLTRNLLRPKLLGGIDFLLHLLSSIVHLPVTKATVKTSGMGRIIGTIEKHSICKDTPNEAAIGERVQQIKEAWNASVKAQKAKEAAAASLSTSSSSNKRAPEEVTSSPSSVKRVKTEDMKGSSFSSLLKKVSASAKVPNGVVSSKADIKPSKLSYVSLRFLCSF